jgi:ATP-binding cassette subfamily B protein
MTVSDPKPPASRPRTLVRLARLLWTVDPRTATFLAVLYAAGGLHAVASVAVLRRLIDTAQQALQGRAPLLAAIGWAGALALLTIAYASGNNLRNVVGGRFQEIMRAEMERRCYRQVQTMPLEQLERAAVHDQLQQARQALQGERLSNTLVYAWQSLSESVTLLSLLLYLGRFHWGLPLLLAAGSTPGILVSQRFLYRRYHLARAQTVSERRFGIYDGLLTGRAAAAELRVFGFGNWLAQRALGLSRGMAAERVAIDVAEAPAMALSNVLGTVGYVVAIAFGVALLLDGRLGVGVVAALFYAFQSFQGSYHNLAQNVGIIADNLRYVRDYFAFTNGPRLDMNAGHRLAGPIRQGITFERVSFTYPGGVAPALDDVSFALRPGERLALVGENGAGKSTLVKLLMGLYRPTAGRILVDGVDLREIAPADWYRRIGTVFQDFARYQTSVRHNIGVGWVERRDDGALVEGAAARSDVLDVAATLPDGLDTPLGKEFHQGQELSVGQWQKLAIARAAMRPAELLILDEPASALDARAEAEVYAQFARMTEGRTAILISHRLGSCRIADRILVLQHGRLLEEGTHTSLLGAGGLYAELYQLQAAWYR